MKKSFREQIENELTAMKNRRDMLDKNIKEYAYAENFIDAGINQIKRDTLQLVIDKLNNILYP